MKTRVTESPDMLPIVAVTMLLILTAWGNAVATLIVSAVALVVALLVFRRD